jgi:hypothetical protein
VALERDEIVRTDFRIERRGYAPEAVDRHLEKVASEVEGLRRGGAKGEGTSTSLAGTAGQRVQAIVDAAESTAAEIERDARTEAARIRDDSSREAKERVGEVRAAADALRSRIDELQGELGSVFDELRANAGRLSDTLVSLEKEAVAVGSPKSDNGPATAAAGEVVTEVEVEAVVVEAEAAPGAVAAEETSEDAQNARLVALNMALNGASRTETERYLAENFTIDDPTALLDDVYAQRGG